MADLTIRLEGFGIRTGERRESRSGSRIVERLLAWNRNGGGTVDRVYRLKGSLIADPATGPTSGCTPCGACTTSTSGHDPLAPAIATLGTARGYSSVNPCRTA